MADAVPFHTRVVTSRSGWSTWLPRPDHFNRGRGYSSGTAPASDRLRHLSARLSGAAPVAESSIVDDPSMQPGGLGCPRRNPCLTLNFGRHAVAHLIGPDGEIGVGHALAQVHRRCAATDPVQAPEPNGNCGGIALDRDERRLVSLVDDEAIRLACRLGEVPLLRLPARQLTRQ